MDYLAQLEYSLKYEPVAAAGSDATNIASPRPSQSRLALTRQQASCFPQDSFSSLKYIQGAPYNSDIVTYFTSISTAQISETGRKSVALTQCDGTEWRTEQLIAMRLLYVKELAEDLAGESVINEVILTVSSYFSQLERDSVAGTIMIDIGGVKTLALVNDGTVVSVNYAMTRTFSMTPEYTSFPAQLSQENQVIQ
jgi:hypoxia up-regulated 1